MRRLVCAFVVRKPPKTGFLASRPKYDTFLETIIQRLLDSLIFVEKEGGVHVQAACSKVGFYIMAGI